MPLKPLLLKNPYGITIPERMVWTQSALRLYRNCKRRFCWKYLFRLDPKYTSHFLILGTAFHECLGEWYKGKHSQMDAIALKRVQLLQKEAQEQHEFYGEDEWLKLQAAIAMFQGMMAGYSQMYAADRNNWVIDRNMIERQFMVNCGEFDYSGKIDLSARLKQRKKAQPKFIVEHKTASDINEAYINRIALDTQCRAYVWGSIHGCGEDIRTVVYDVVRKSKLRLKQKETATEFCERISDDYLSRPGFYFYREPLIVSKSDLDAFEFEMRQTHKDYELWCSGEFGDPLDPRTWGINDDYCTAYHRTCEYFQLCAGSLDRGTATFYDQRETLHRELADV